MSELKKLRLRFLLMKIDLNIFREQLQSYVKGFTTNPSLMRKM